MLGCVIVLYNSGFSLMKNHPENPLIQKDMAEKSSLDQ